MQSLRLAIRRSAAQSGLLTAIGAVSLVLSALIVGCVGYLSISDLANTRRFVAEAPPTARALQVEAKLDADPAAQSGIADKLFGELFDGLPVEISRSLTDYPIPAAIVNPEVSDSQNSESRGSQSQNSKSQNPESQDTESQDPSGTSTPLQLENGHEARITPASDAELDTHARLTAGSWIAAESGAEPDGTVQGVLQSKAAEQLGLKVGDILELGLTGHAIRVKIVGTWLPTDSNDPRWFSDPGVATGIAKPAGDGTPSFGPLIVDERALPSFGPIPSVHWTISVETDRVDPETLAQLGTVATRLTQNLVDLEGLEENQVVVYGALADTAATVERGLNSVRGVTPIGILLVSLIGLISLAQLARLLSLARRPENALLRSRGASANWLTLAGLGEALLVALIGCGLGVVAAALSLVALFDESSLGFVVWELGALVAAAVVVIFGVVASIDAARIAKRDAVNDSGRVRSAATVGATVLALAAAGVSVWQLLLYGSPVVATASGGTALNPLAVIAPALSLIALALVFLLIFGPLTSLWQQLATARKKLQPSFSARQVARGIAGFAVAVLVVTLAIGGLAVAAGYSGSWRDLGERNARLSTGGSAQIVLTKSDFPPAGSVEVTGSEYLTVPGVKAVAPVFTTPLSIGDSDGGQLTAIPANAIQAVVDSIDGNIDTIALAKKLGTFEQMGIPLPAGTKAVKLNVGIEIQDGMGEPATTTGYAETTLWFQDSVGALSSKTLPAIDLGTLSSDDKAPANFTVELGESSYDRWLVAIDYSVSADNFNSWVQVHYDSLEAVTGSGTQKVPLDTSKWGNLQFSSFAFSTVPDTDGLSLGLAATRVVGNKLRMMYVDASITPNGFQYNYGDDPVPVAVTEEFAKAYNLKPGGTVDLRFEGSGLSVKTIVAAVVPILPGVQAKNQALVDLNKLNDYILRNSSIAPSANQIWLATNATSPADQSKLAPDIRNTLPEGASLTLPTDLIQDSFSTPAEIALWICAIGSLLLALISLGAVTITIGRARKVEVPVLRAVGLSAGQQSKSRLGELIAVMALSVLFGLAGGIAVSALTVLPLAKSAILNLPPGLNPGLVFNLTYGGVLLAAALLAMLLIGIVSAASVRRQALDTDERIETR